MRLCHKGKDHQPGCGKQICQHGAHQQRENFSGSADVADPASLAQQSGFFRIAQMRQYPAEQVDAFANVERQAAFFALEDIDPGSHDGLAEVSRVCIRPDWIELG